MVYTKAALSRLATEVRRELGLSDSVPFDAHLWAKEYGIPFVSLQDLVDAAGAVQHFMRERPDRWSAALVKNGTGHLVVYNSAHADVRVRSDLAHEIAHLVAEHKLNAAWMEDARCSGASKPQEKEAGELAGALLVPLETAKAHAIKRRPASSLANQFGVSLEMASWRMQVSGGEIIARRAAKRRATYS